MNTRSKSLLSALALFAAALIVPGAVRAQDDPAPAPAAAPEKDAPPAAEPEIWTGDIHLPGGMKLEFNARLTAGEGGAYTGVLGIPAQGIEDEALKDVRVSAEQVKFTFAPQGAPPPAWAVFTVNLKADGEVDSASMFQMGQTFEVTIKRAAPGADPAAEMRPQNPKPPYPYSQRELSLVNGADGTRLVGTLITPGKPADGELVSSQRHPAVIFITGSGPQDRDETVAGHKPFLVIADHLARNGIASFRMDDRGVGGSTGELFKSSVYDLAGDIKTAFQALRVQPDIDPNRIGLIGHSEGGAIAPLVATDIPEIRFMVLMAGTGVPGRDVMTHQSGLIMKASGASDEVVAAQLAAHRALMDALTTGGDSDTIEAAIRALVETQAQGQEIREDQLLQIVASQKAALTSPWLMSFMIYDPRVKLRSVRCSVLAINGELDLQVDPDQNLVEIERALKEGGATDVTCVRLEGLNHLFQPSETGLLNEYSSIRTTIDPAVLDLMTKWIRSHTGLE
jgi:pimeloyl-ACP methyl ester carboxylesterase